MILNSEHDTSLIYTFSSIFIRNLLMLNKDRKIAQDVLPKTQIAFIRLFSYYVINVPDRHLNAIQGQIKGSEP